MSSERVSTTGLRPQLERAHNHSVEWNCTVKSQLVTITDKHIDRYSIQRSQIVFPEIGACHRSDRMAQLWPAGPEREARAAAVAGANHMELSAFHIELG